MKNKTIYHELDIQLENNIFDPIKLKTLVFFPLHLVLVLGKTKFVCLILTKKY